jgi:hypothetical protein
MGGIVSQRAGPPGTIEKSTKKVSQPRIARRKIRWRRLLLRRMLQSAPAAADESDVAPATKSKLAPSKSSKLHQVGSTERTDDNFRFGRGQRESTCRRPAASPATER